MHHTQFKLQSFGMVVFAILMAGCSNMSGLDGQSKFSCAAAPGVNCQSMSGVAQNADAGNLPFQRSETDKNNVRDNKKESRKAEEEGGIPEYAPDRLKKEKMSPADMRAVFTGEPIRQPPLVLRVWMAPYENEHGDLYDQSFFYMQVHNGRWMLDATQSNIRRQYRPVHRADTQEPVEQPVSTTNKSGSTIKRMD